MTVKLVKTKLAWSSTVPLRCNEKKAFIESKSEGFCIIRDAANWIYSWHLVFISEEAKGLNSAPLPLVSLKEVYSYFLHGDCRDKLHSSAPEVKCAVAQTKSIFY